MVHYHPLRRALAASCTWRTPAHMPLRARILLPAANKVGSIQSRPHSPPPTRRDPVTDRASQNLSTLASLPQEQPSDEPDDVLFNTLYGLRTIELNRPKKLNSLNGSMARKIVLRLKVRELVSFRQGLVYGCPVLTIVSDGARNGKSLNWQMSSLSKVGAQRLSAREETLLPLHDWCRRRGRREDRREKSILRWSISWIIPSLRTRNPTWLLWMESRWVAESG